MRARTITADNYLEHKVFISEYMDVLSRLILMDAILSGVVVRDVAFPLSKLSSAVFYEE